MRATWVAAALAVVMLAGCAEQLPEPVQEAGGEAEAPTTDTNATVEAFNGTLTALVENTTIAAGTSFNVTLDLVGEADLANLTWTLTFFNGTENLTMLAENDTVVYDGVGLPAVVEANLTWVGNVTMTAATVVGNATVEAEPLVLELLSAGPTDPCAGAAIQAPISISALYAGAAVDGTGLYQGHAFALEPCQTIIKAEITSGEAYLDPMLRLKDNTGATVDAEDNEFLYHDTLTYEPGGYLEPGNWQIDARAYAGGPGNYEIVLTFE